MWKCSPVGSSTRNANTTTTWIQYDATYPAWSTAGDRPANAPAIARPANAWSRSCAMPASLSAKSAKRKPSNIRSVTTIAVISDRTSSASRLGSRRAGGRT